MWTLRIDQLRTSGLEYGQSTPLSRIKLSRDELLKKKKNLNEKTVKQKLTSSLLFNFVKAN